METLWQDLRYSFRMLWKSPGFTAVTVLTLALGIGANSAIFSIVNAVLLRPLPYKDPDRLVVLLEKSLRSGGWFPVSAANFNDWRNQNQVFEQMAAASAWGANLTDIGQPEQLGGLRVSANLFPMLGIKPILGRTFLPEEEKPGDHRVVVVSYGFWQRRFGSDPSLVGQTLTLNSESFIVIGIMPPDFQFPPFWFTNAELWAPMALEANQMSNRRGHYLRVFARLKPGLRLAQARAEMDTIARRLAQEYSSTNAGTGVVVDPLHEKVVGNIRPALLVLLAAVGFVLLIACVNVANLLLARAAERHREIAVRTALGAGRLRLIRQLLTESVLFALLSGALGLLLALWGTDVLVALSPSHLPRMKEIHIDGWVLGFTLVISLVTGVMFGLAPALQASKTDLNESLKEGGRGMMVSFRRQRIRGLLVVSEVALTLVLLIGAGLMIKSFLRLRQIDPGFNPENVLTMTVSVAGSGYSEGYQRAAFYQQLIQRVEALPGVQSVGAINHLPLGGDTWSNGFVIQGRPIPVPGELPSVIYRVITPNYFRTMGISLRRGRPFAEQDVEGAPAVVIINETTARRFWRDEDPVGHRLKLGAADSNNPWLTIVGVVGDVRQREWAAEPRPEIYLPYLQNPSPWSYMTLVARTATDLKSLAAAIRKEVWAIDKNLPVSSIQTMEQVISRSVAQPRFDMLLLGIFAAVALVLAAVGIYGVMSYLVTQRTHEIGIRMALGAQSRDVLGLVVRQGMIPASIGVIIGLAAAFGLTRLMKSLLFGVSATDPATFAAVVVVLLAVGLLANYIPARRAAKVDPIVALRYE